MDLHYGQLIDLALPCSNQAAANAIGVTEAQIADLRRRLPLSAAVILALLRSGTLDAQHLGQLGAAAQAQLDLRRATKDSRAPTRRPRRRVVRP